MVDTIKASRYANKIGVYVSDNASNDGTKEILDEMYKLYKLSSISFDYQILKNNVGFGGNVIETLNKPDSEYIWWCSDRDLICLDKIDVLISELLMFKPNVCSVGTIQPPYTEENPRYDTSMHGYYNNTELVHEVFSTKLSSLIVKKSQAKDFDYDAVSKSLWAHVLIALPIILKTKSYYIFSQNMASVNLEKNYLHLRYMPSAFFDLQELKRDIYTSLGIKQAFLVSNRRVTRFGANLNYLLLVLTKKATVAESVWAEMKKELVEDFFIRFGFLDWINYRAILIFIVKYINFSIRR